MIVKLLFSSRLSYLIWPAHLWVCWADCRDTHQLLISDPSLCFCFLRQCVGVHVCVCGVLREPTCLRMSAYVGVHRPFLLRCSHTRASLRFRLRCKQSHDSLGIPQPGPSLSFFYSHSKTLSHSPRLLLSRSRVFYFQPPFSVGVWYRKGLWED